LSSANRPAYSLQTSPPAWGGAAVAVFPASGKGEDGVAPHLVVNQVLGGGKQPGGQVLQSVPAWSAMTIVQRCVAQLPDWNRIRQISFFIFLLGKLLPAELPGNPR